MKQSKWQKLLEICLYDFPNPLKVPKESGDLITLGADLDPETLIFAYSHGLFPMHIDVEGQSGKTLGWFSPYKRAIFPLDSLRVTRSMRKSAKKYEVRVDTCFSDMMRLCMTVPRQSGWIDEEFVEAYTELHELGFAHSVEVFFENKLVGGLYGVGFAGFFAGESMVHTMRDASKVALMSLVEILNKGGATLLDAQWMTPHLATLGAREVPREKYFELLKEGLKVDEVPWSKGEETL
jgi:leucyl/phenylalanyl-tRNA--protein transferase